MSDLGSPSIHVYDVRSGETEPLITLTSLHRAPVTAMRYNAAFDTVVSADTKVGRDTSVPERGAAMCFFPPCAPLAHMPLDLLVHP